MIINSIVLTNNTCFSSNTGKRYSYSDTCKNEASISFALTLNQADFPPLSPPIHAYKCKHSPYANNCNCDLWEIHDSNYVSSMSKPVSTKTVCKSVCIVSCNKPIIFSPVCKSLHASKICIDKTVRCCINTEPVSGLISSEPVKSFVTRKPVCFSSVSMAKEFNSVNYCLVTCTKHLVNVNSSIVKKSVVSCRTACPVDFDIVAKTVNITLLCTYCCVSFKIPHDITPTVIFILELPLHSARSPATLSVCSSPSSTLHQYINSQKYHPHQHCHHHYYYHHHHLYHYHNLHCSYYHHH